MGTLSWAFSAVLGLVALQALTSRQGSGRVGQMFGDVNRLVERVLDPTVPAIPDRRTARSQTTASAAEEPAKTKIPRMPAVGQQRAV